MDIKQINGVSQIIKSYNKQDKKQTKRLEKNKKIDNLSLSKEALQLQKAKKELVKASNKRQEKINKLKTQVKQGTYNVKGEDIAEKMLDQVMVDKRV